MKNEIMKKIEQLKRALALLERYEDWEAELIGDDRCWEPHGMASNPRLTNELYEKMFGFEGIQSERNEILGRFKEVAVDTAKTK